MQIRRALVMFNLCFTELNEVTEFMCRTLTFSFPSKLFYLLCNFCLVQEGSGEQAKVVEIGCEMICGAPTTLVVKG